MAIGHIYTNMPRVFCKSFIIRVVTWRLEEFKWAGHEDGSKDPLCILKVRIGLRKIHGQS